MSDPEPIGVGTKLRCPLCGVMGIFTSDPKTQRLNIGADVGGPQHMEYVTEIRIAQCPNEACGKWIVDEVHETRYDNGHEHDERVTEFKRLFPQLPSAREVSAFVPEELASFVKEASQIQHVSLRGAASMLRHCLEAVLVAKGYGALGDYLNDLIKKAEADKELPRSLISHFKLLQQIGAFGSHAMGLTVEPGEVDQLFESIDAAFDAFYIQPRKLEEAKRKVDAKLATIDRKPMTNPKPNH